MPTFSESKIKEIAEFLDMGFLCYVHKQTGEIENYPDELKMPYFEEELWEDVKKKIDDDRENFIEFEGMNSNESVRVMERFVDSLEEGEVKNRLSYALNQSKPFKNFRYELDYYDDIKNRWFDFKASETNEWVKEQIDSYNENPE